MNDFFPILVIFLLATADMSAQNFTHVSDANNPINTVALVGAYRGVAWVDIDNDGDLDLSCLNWAFKNLGEDNFEIVQSFGGGPAGLDHRLGSLSWNDFDNDGDFDCLYAYNSNSGTWTGETLMYVNDGDGNFVSQNIDTNQSTRAWSAAAGDFDNDGYVDIVGAVAFQFAGLTTPGFFYKGNSDGSFSKIDSFPFTQNTAPYTVAYWLDYDTDGDSDLFIASGPAGSAAPDYNYRNHLKENGTPGLESIGDLPFGTDNQDGQCYNAIDYDLDNDLDIFLTNYSGAPNRFYENENGAYTSVSNNLTFSGAMLGNCWGDFDNDGDEDVLITGDNVVASGYFENQGGSFQKISNPFQTLFASGNVSGLSIGDYDMDGDLDFFATGGPSSRALFKNETEEGFHWVQFDLEGSLPSNRAALGTNIWIKVQIDGQDKWLHREVSAHNTFMGHNALRVHFGLKNSTVIDSVRILWPSCQEQIITNLQADSIYQITESDIMNSVFSVPSDKLPLIVIYPNPGNNIILLSVPENFNPSPGQLSILTAEGKEVRNLSTSSSTIQVDLSKLPSAIYILHWTFKTGETFTGKVVVKK